MLTIPLCQSILWKKRGLTQSIDASPFTNSTNNMSRLDRKFAPKSSPKSNFLVYAKGLCFFNCLIMDHQFLAKISLNVGSSLRFGGYFDHFVQYNQPKTIYDIAPPPSNKTPLVPNTCINIVTLRGCEVLFQVGERCCRG